MPSSARWRQALKLAIHVFVIGFLVSSCVTAPLTRRHPETNSESVLTETEVSGARAISAYEMVEQLRPRFLTASGGHAFATTVYLDGQPIGGVAELHRIPALSVGGIRFLTAMEATAIHGAQGRSGAAIEVTTRRRG